MPAGPRSVASWPTTLVAWALSAAVTLPFCFEAIGEPDAGWSLAIGRAIVMTGLPRTNLLTWTEHDHPWYPTAWLFDVLLFGADRQLGPLGLQLLIAALMGLTLLGLAVACQQLHERGPFLVPAMALLFVPRLLPRPHLASWAAEAWVFALCLMAESRGPRWRLACVPIIALASNLHAGAVFPLLVLGAFALQHAWMERAWGREGLVMALGVLALFANPGALFNLRDNLAHLQVGAHLSNHEEFQHGWPWMVPALYVAGVVAMAAAWSQRRERPVLLPLVIVFFGLGVFAVRFAAEFPLVAAPAIAGSFASLGRQRWWLVALFATLGVSTQVGHIGRLLPAAAWDEHALPVRAAAFVQAEGIQGRLFNAFEDGGYLEYALPDRPAFQDGRVMAFPASFFREQGEAERSPQEFDRYLRRLGVEWAITPSGQCSYCGAGLLTGADWALVYWDDTTEVRLRRDVPRYAELIERLEFRFLRPRDPPKELLDRARTVPPPEAMRFAREAERFTRAMPTSPYGPLLRCATLSRLRDPAAESFCDQARRLDDDPRWQDMVKAAEQSLDAGSLAPPPNVPQPPAPHE